MRARSVNSYRAGTAMKWEPSAMQRAGKKALAPILDTIRKNDQLTLKYKIREFPIANRLVGLPLASNSVSVSGAPKRPPRTVDHNVSVILNDQVRSRMPLS